MVEGIRVESGRWGQRGVAVHEIDWPLLEPATEPAAAPGPGAAISATEVEPDERA